MLIEPFVSATKNTWRTLPCLKAVRVGGAGNHRYNLSSGVLIKDNHIDAAGGITQAIEACRALADRGWLVELSPYEREAIS